MRRASRRREPVLLQRIERCVCAKIRHVSSLGFYAMCIWPVKQVYQGYLMHCWKLSRGWVDNTSNPGNGHVPICINNWDKAPTQHARLQNQNAWPSQHESIVHRKPPRWCAQTIILTYSQLNSTMQAAYVWKRDAPGNGIEQRGKHGGGGGKRKSCSRGIAVSVLMILSFSFKHRKILLCPHSCHLKFLNTSPTQSLPEIHTSSET